MPTGTTKNGEKFMFDTKIAIVVREDLATWQKLNVTAFLMSGITGANPEIMGEPYRDAAGHTYHSLCIQPVIVLSADQGTLKNVHNRALSRDVPHGLYIEEMFSTGHDEANRAVFAEHGPEDAKVVGIALRAEKKIIDKITKGAKMHA
jgi:hypothetical protein|tara:strand:- start:8728 stop:9171 length:444 start_codon:yes stop_codon:yes gene_type:complete